MKKFIGFLTFLVILIIVGAVYFYSKRENVSNLIYQKSIDMIKKEALSRLPAEYTKEQADALFSQALQKLQSGNYNKKKFEHLRSSISKSLQDNKLESGVY